ncbi:conserved hypothetical protein [Methylobacterium sp. 4-46]|uniref:hypothetical protein n=1 Tax=unclassified Methylobacterium TaxID=2615210 RepID=UPI000152DED1|nr:MULTISPECIES: hypothetical protein [Methylobacterium]ACA20500.1 conserved hypothetical protein [Methylobacterium sp. 4-46]WFT79666.1 hypothetical protein QA634_31485 [Methylobacterium nodulans]
MADQPRHASPATALIARLMRIVRTCPEATADVLELVLLVSQIEALTAVDRDYRDAKRVIARLRHPLWDMAPDQRAVLRRAADTIREVCGLAEADIPPDPIADAGERERVEAQLAAALAAEFTPAQIAKVTGAVMAVLQASGSGRAAEHGSG